MDISPFDPTFVFVWGKDASAATRLASGYYARTFGVAESELVAKRTGLTNPGGYNYDAVNPNLFAQTNKKQDTPSEYRYLVRPTL